MCHNILHACKRMLRMLKVQCLGMLLVIGSEPTYVVALVEANNSKSHLVDYLYVVSLILLCNQLIPLWSFF